MSPNWSDDEGRCHFEVDGVPCYLSSIGCPMHGGQAKCLDNRPRVRGRTGVRRAGKHIEGDVMPRRKDSRSEVDRFYSTYRSNWMVVGAARESMKGVYQACTYDGVTRQQAEDTFRKEFGLMPEARVFIFDLGTKAGET